MGKQLTVRQQQWLDQAVPQMDDSSEGTFSLLLQQLLQLGGVVVPYTSNATANTADSVTHNLGRVPTGYIVIQNGNGGVVYNGGASQAFAATSTTITLKSTVGANACQLIVF